MLLKILKDDFKEFNHLLKRKLIILNNEIV